MISYKSRVYLHGLLSATIQSAASTTAVIALDPEDFNFTTGLPKLGTAVFVFALVGFFGYLKDHPLPDPEKDIDYVSEVKKQITDLKGTGDGSFK